MAASSSPDIELGSNGESPQHLPGPARSTTKNPVKIFSFWRRARSWDILQNRQNENRCVETQIEDHPLGYPRFSALMGSHDGFHIFRRFSNLRMRLLLLAQDRVVQLEEKLNEIDRKTAPLFLACSRRDKNTARQEVLSEIQEALTSYDNLIQRNSGTLLLEEPRPQHVQSLRNWLAGNPCIARKEAEFLQRENDLACFSRPDDNVVSWLEQFVSSLHRYVPIQSRSTRNVSRDSHVHILPQAFTGWATRAIVALVIALLVLVPVIMCNKANSLNARLAVMIFAATIFVTLMSLLTKSKMIELAVAGATYVTVLIVFISGPTNSLS